MIQAKNSIIAVFASKHPDDFPEWRDRFAAHFDGLEQSSVHVTLVSMDDPRAAEARIALAWLPEPGYLATLPKLELICSMGMGVNGLADDPSIAQDIPIVRLIDENIILQMCEYVLGDIIRVRRAFDEYAALQRQSTWQRIEVAHARDTVVTILGLGAIGSKLAKSLLAMDYQVRAWRNRYEAMSDVEVFAGESQLSAALDRADFIINVLPLTPQTEGILNLANLQPVTEGAHLINIARGAHLNESDLLTLLENGKLGSATLDVMQVEPLPADHPFWLHPQIRLTPHVSGLTHSIFSAEQIIATIENYLDSEKDEPLANQVNRNVGY